MKTYINGQYIELTQEEIDEMKRNQRIFEVQEKHRPLTSFEVQEMFIKAQVNTVDIDDQTSLRMINYYPVFNDIIGQTVKMGFKFTYQGKLYKTIQDNLLIQEHYAPGVGTESLYTRIDEEHDGDIYDPIPYEGNMALINGKYYVQNGVTYKCIRDTVNPVYNVLNELVGLYVEESTL